MINVQYGKPGDIYNGNGLVLSLIQYPIQSCLIMSDAFSAIMMTGAFVLPDTMLGMIDASTTLRLETPYTRSRGSTTDVTSSIEPILQVPTG
mgnify:CR=1 FL=1